MNTISPSVINREAALKSVAPKSEQSDSVDGDQRLVDEFLGLLSAARRAGTMSQDELAALQFALAQTAAPQRAPVPQVKESSEPQCAPKSEELSVEGDGTAECGDEGGLPQGASGGAIITSGVALKQHRIGGGMPVGSVQEGPGAAPGVPLEEAGSMTAPALVVAAAVVPAEVPAVVPATRDQVLVPSDEAAVWVMPESTPSPVVSAPEAGAMVAEPAPTSMGNKDEAPLLDLAVPGGLPSEQPAQLERAAVLPEADLKKAVGPRDGKLHRTFGEEAAGPELISSSPPPAGVLAPPAETEQPRMAPAGQLAPSRLAQLAAQGEAATVPQSSAPKPMPVQGIGEALQGVGAVARPSAAVLQTMLLRQAFEQARGMRGLDRAAAPVGGVAQPQASFGQSATLSAGLERRPATDGQSKPPRPLNRAEVTRMVQRVEVVMKEAARARDGKTISFRVEPYNLGEVKVDVSLRDGALHARLKAENPQVASALRDRAHELQGALRKLGLEVDAVTVTVLSEDADTNTAADSGGSNAGKNFQDQGHNLPGQTSQPIENTVGNKIAENSGPAVQPLAAVILDHWVA